MNRIATLVLAASLMLAANVFAAEAKTPAVPEPPKKPATGYFQEITHACTVETNVSAAFTKKIAAMVKPAEEKFYTLFKLTPDLMQGWAKEKFDQKANIPGTIMHQLKIRPWIDIKVYKDQETFGDEWFELTKVTDPAIKATQNLPGAYFSIGPDYTSNGWAIRKIRSFVSNRDDEELERTLLHEMGHLFIETYILGFAVGGRSKAASEDKRDLPAWLNEGTAQLFELLFSKAASSKKALMKQQAMIYEAVKIKDSYPFKEFTEIANAHNLKAVANDPLKATINYAQSASVMDYMVNVDGKRFFDFLTNMREFHFKRNLGNPDPNHVSEFFSFQDEAFKKAFNCRIEEVEPFWVKHINKTMAETLKKQPEMHYWIGEYYLRRKKGKEADLKRAEEEFNIAMKEAPLKGEGYLGSGRMLMRKQDYVSALPLLIKAADFMKTDEDAWFYLGMAQLNTTLYSEAVESFDKSLKLNPRNPNSLSGMGTAAMQAKQYDKAIKAYEDAYESSRNLRFLFQKGRAAYFAGNYELAQQGFASFANIYKNDAEGAFWYGMAAWRLGKDKEFALKKLDEAVKLQPNDPTYAEGLKMAQAGETLRFVGEPTEAEIAAAKIKKDPVKEPLSKPVNKPLMQMVDDE